jgi:hypothetical protein
VGPHNSLILQMHKLSPREKYWSEEATSTKSLGIEWGLEIPYFLLFWVLALEPCFKVFPLLHKSTCLVYRWGCWLRS